MSNKSYYKAKMKEYKKARDKLESYEKELNEYIDNCLGNFKEFHSVYEAQYNLQGEVIENLNSSSETFNKEVEQLFSKIEDDINIVNNEKSKSEELYQKYKELYEDACKHDSWGEKLFD